MSNSGIVLEILNKVKRILNSSLFIFEEKIWPSFRHSCGGVIIFSRDTSIESFVDYFVESGAVQPEQSLLWVNNLLDPLVNSNYLLFTLIQKLLQLKLVRSFEEHLS